MRDMIFPRVEYTNWLSNAQRSALKIDIQMTLYQLNILCLGPYVHAITINLKCVEIEGGDIEAFE